MYVGQDLIEKGEALHCPSCEVLLLKKWGCDWVRCTYCRTEICWVTRQLRWGPNVRGFIILQYIFIIIIYLIYISRAEETPVEAASVW